MFRPLFSLEAWYRFFVCVCEVDTQLEFLVPVFASRGFFSAFKRCRNTILYRTLLHGSYLNGLFTCIQFNWRILQKLKSFCLTVCFRHGPFWSLELFFTASSSVMKCPQVECSSNTVFKSPQRAGKSVSNVEKCTTSSEGVWSLSDSIFSNLSVSTEKRSSS